MAKYSAGPTMVLTFQPDGSTTTTTVSANARNITLDESIDSADSTGYGNANRQYVATIADAGLSFEFMLDDTTYTVEDLFTKGAEGTWTISPAGTGTGKKKITFPGFVSTRNRQWPYDDVAMASIEALPTGDVTDAVHSP